jgi:hypothetical protein
MTDRSGMDSSETDSSEREQCVVEEQHEVVVLTAGLPRMESVLESRMVKFQDTPCTDEEAVVTLNTWMDLPERGNCRLAEAGRGAAESALPLAVYSMAGCSPYLHHVSFVVSERGVMQISRNEIR